jgi:hypothetical protein
VTVVLVLTHVLTTSSKTRAKHQVKFSTTLAEDLQYW